ncbi:MAG: endonuclease [Methylobacterium sp.]|nr:endonuclease [Methylobacterium sp.]
MTRREFPNKVKAAAFQRANGQCEVCGARLTVGKFRYDHRLPDALGGEPTLDNCVVQCLPCDKPKTADDVRRIRKADRQRNHHLGIRPPSRLRGPGFPKYAPQRSATRKLQKPAAWRDQS